MESLRQRISLVLICVIVLIFSVAGIAAAFVTRIELDIDGILLIAIGLMMAGIFGLMLLLIARELGWIPARAKKAENSAAGEKKPGTPQPASGS
jgi:hypothetical protein